MPPVASSPSPSTSCEAAALRPSQGARGAELGDGDGVMVRGGEGGEGWWAPRRNASYPPSYPLSDFMRVSAVAASSRAELTLQRGRGGDGEGRGEKEEGK